MNQATRRDHVVFAALALLSAFVITRGTYQQPGGFTDVFYHFNAANRLVTGQGLTDAYLWTYIGATETLPAPSHLYWMPLTSISAAIGMWLINAPGDYAAAQWPFALMFAATACVGFSLGAALGHSRRHAWIAGLLTLFSGYFTRFWGAVDTFAPYALAGSLCLLCLAQLGVSSKRYTLWAALAGILAALGHLTRADGLLLLLIGWAVLLWPLYRTPPVPLGQRLLALLVMTAAYLITMSPWFLRNLNAIGAPLPLGGTQAIWLTEYDDLFNYPPDNSPATLFASGLNSIVSTRWEALINNLGTFIAVEGLVVMTPLMLIGLWRRRADGRLRGFWLYALGLHLAMTLVFPFPGYRGGLLHSAAALVPWWAALGVVGLDDCIAWAGRRRRWNQQTAQRVFSAALVAVAVYLSVTVALPNRVLKQDTPLLYQELVRILPEDARIMVNDPARLYHYTGFGGSVLPNETPDAIPLIARQYGIDYLLIEDVTDDGRASTAASPRLWPLLYETLDFLSPVPLNIPGVRLYEIRD